MDDALNEKLIKLIRCIQNTYDDEINPIRWDMQSAQVAETFLQDGKISPEIQHYLENAPDCREEFYALVALLRAEQALQAESDEN